jgi:hypothetical protein
MATWFEITFTGEPSQLDRELAAQLIEDGCNSGQLHDDDDGPGDADGYDALDWADREDDA